MGDVVSIASRAMCYGCGVRRPEQQLLAWEGRKLCHVCFNNADAAVTANQLAVETTLQLPSRMARLHVLRLLLFAIEDCEEQVRRGEV